MSPKSQPVRLPEPARLPESANSTKATKEKESSTKATKEKKSNEITFGKILRESVIEVLGFLCCQKPKEEKKAPTQRKTKECTKEYIFVDFNAWEYAASEELWAGLIRQIYCKVEKRIEREEAPEANYRPGYYKRWWRAKRGLQALKELYGTGGLYRIAIYALLVLLAVVAVVVMETTGIVTFVQSIRDSTEGAIAVVSASVAAVLAVAPAGALAWRSNRESGQSRGEKIFNEARHVKDSLGFLADVKLELQELFQFLTGPFKEETGWELIIVAFVDDLDRCLQGRNVKVLEAMQLVISVPGAPVIAFLAIDSRVVVASIEESFGDVLRNAHISGWEYLDKIVQIPFSMPEPSPEKTNRLVTTTLQGKGGSIVAVAARIRKIAERLQQQRESFYLFFPDVHEANVVAVSKLIVEGESDNAMIARVAELLSAGTKRAARLGRAIGGPEGDEVIRLAVNEALLGMQVVRHNHPPVRVNVASVDLGEGGEKWVGGVLGLDGCVYGIPANAAKVLCFDPKTQEATLVGADLGEGGEKWVGGVLGPDGCVYGIPANASKVLRFDPTTQEATLVGADLGNGGYKWVGGVLGPDGCVYGIPHVAAKVLRFDPKTQEATLVGADLGKGGDKWQGGVLGPDGCVYGIPCEAAKVLRFDPKTQEATLVGADLGEGGFKWQGGVLGPDGCVYGIPHKATKVLCVAPFVPSSWKPSGPKAASSPELRAEAPVEAPLVITDAPTETRIVDRTAALDSALTAEIFSDLDSLVIKPLVSQHEMSVFERMCLVLEPNPRRLKRVMQTYTLISEVAKRRAVEEGGPPDHVVGKLRDWPDFTSKLVKWTCLCELYPYRMSLLVLIVTDFEQKQTVNRLATKREEASKREGKEEGGGGMFFRYVPTLQKHAAVSDATGAGKDVMEFPADDEYISTFYNKHVERFLYSLGLSQKMLRLDGDAELFQTLLMLPAPGTGASSAEETFVDICIKDILGPSPEKKAHEKSKDKNLKEQLGINQRDANLSLLTYSFNLNPALRHQLSCEIAALQTEAELGHGEERAIQATGVVEKQRMIEASVRQQLGLGQTPRGSKLPVVL